ncbi:hypothetical protein WJX74_000647 [Apatococcus lobatus]|uniref:Uncharacterized protein n=1 Tax=Apatococcus lobatus TaxID=904363 RepID=A0AAW1RTE7_9CHLO
MTSAQHRRQTRSASCIGRPAAEVFKGRYILRGTPIRAALMDRGLVGTEAPAPKRHRPLQQPSGGPDQPTDTRRAAQWCPGLDCTDQQPLPQRPELAELAKTLTAGLAGLQKYLHGQSFKGVDIPPDAQSALPPLGPRSSLGQQTLEPSSNHRKRSRPRSPAAGQSTGARQRRSPRQLSLLQAPCQPPPMQPSSAVAADPSPASVQPASSQQLKQSCFLGHLPPATLLSQSESPTAGYQSSFPEQTELLNRKATLPISSRPSRQPAAATEKAPSGALLEWMHKMDVKLQKAEAHIEEQGAMLQAMHSHRVSNDLQTAASSRTHQHMPLGTAEKTQAGGSKSQVVLPVPLATIQAAMHNVLDKKLWPLEALMEQAVGSHGDMGEVLHRLEMLHDLPRAGILTMHALGQLFEVVQHLKAAQRTGRIRLSKQEASKPACANSQFGNPTNVQEGSSEKGIPADACVQHTAGTGLDGSDGSMCPSSSPTWATTIPDGCKDDVAVGNAQALPMALEPLRRPTDSINPTSAMAVAARQDFQTAEGDCDEMSRIMTGCDGNDVHDEALLDQTDDQDAQPAPRRQQFNSIKTLKPAARVLQAGVHPLRETAMCLPKIHGGISSELTPPAPQVIIPQAGAFDWLEFPDWGATPEHDDEPKFCGSDEQSAHLHIGKSHAARDTTPHSPQRATAQAAIPMVKAFQACMTDAANACIEHTAGDDLQSRMCLEASAAAPETAHHQYLKNVQHLTTAAHEPSIVNASAAVIVASSGLQQYSQQVLMQQHRPMEDTANGISGSLPLQPAVACRLPSNNVQGKAAQGTCQQISLPCQHASGYVLPAHGSGHLHDQASAISTLSLQHSLLAAADTRAMPTCKLPVNRKRALVPSLDPLQMNTGHPPGLHGAGANEEAAINRRPLQREVTSQQFPEQEARKGPHTGACKVGMAGWQDQRLVNEVHGQQPAAMAADAVLPMSDADQQTAKKLSAERIKSAADVDSISLSPATAPMQPVGIPGGYAAQPELQPACSSAPGTLYVTATKKIAIEHQPDSMNAAGRTEQAPVSILTSSQDGSRSSNGPMADNLPPHSRQPPNLLVMRMSEAASLEYLPDSNPEDGMSVGCERPQCVVDKEMAVDVPNLPEAAGPSGSQHEAVIDACDLATTAKGQAFSHEALRKECNPFAGMNDEPHNVALPASLMIADRVKQRAARATTGMHHAGPARNQRRRGSYNDVEAATSSLKGATKSCCRGAAGDSKQRSFSSPAASLPLRTVNNRGPDSPDLSNSSCSRSF